MNPFLNRPAPFRPSTRFVVLIVACCSSFSLAAAGPSPGAPAAARYEWRKEHSRDGTGKFYMGREIALVMGHQAAEWLERPERNTEELPETLVAQLMLKPGDIVVDIGAGTGYFSRRLAKNVGPSGRVLAVDIQPEMLDRLTNTMARLGLTNVVPILGTATDPKLPAVSVDLVLLVDVYHEFDHPFEMV